MLATASSQHRPDNAMFAGVQYMPTTLEGTLFRHATGQRLQGQRNLRIQIKASPTLT